MKKMNKVISLAVLVCFIFNTVSSDYVFALSPMPGSVVPETREAMYAAAQKEWAAAKGPGAIDFEPTVFTGDVPRIDGLKFVTPTGMPQGWDNNDFLRMDISNITEALQYFLTKEARLDGSQFTVEERYYELGKGREGELPLTRWERSSSTGRWTLVVHPDFARMWKDLKANDVWFEMDMPDPDNPGKTQRRTVSLAWAVFYRVAKHEMSDRAKGLYPKSRGHMESVPIHVAWGTDAFTINKDELEANMIKGRYALVNDAIWMWFLGSYCFRKTTQFNNDTLRDRLLWFFGLYKGTDDAELNRWALAHELHYEFPNLHSAKAREEAIALAQAINYQFYGNGKYRSTLTPVTAEGRERERLDYEQKVRPDTADIMPTTGKVADALPDSDLIEIRSLRLNDDERVTLSSTADDTRRVALAKNIFKRAFNRAWEIVTKAAGRDNAQGEHVDYNPEQFKSGKTHLFSMGGAIQNNFLATVARRDDGMVRIAHADAGEAVTFRLSDLKALQDIAIQERKDKTPKERRIIPEWANHTMGTLMQAVGQQGLSTGVDILLTSNVPYGAGLSNSAANCVAVTMALDDLFGWNMDKKAIVTFARDGEHDGFVGSSCGWLDQLLIVFSKAGFFAMIDYATMAVTYFKSKLPSTLQRVLVNTNVPHDLAQTEYTDRNYGELPKAHATLAALLPEREINGSTSLTLGEINRLINLFSGEDNAVDFADRDLLKRQGFITDEELAAIDRDTLPPDEALLQRFAALGYAKPEYEKDGRIVKPFRHENITNEQSFALCLRRMRHQLTSALRTPLTGRAAKEGDAVSFGELIDAEGRSLRMSGDFQITGENLAQDELLDIGFAVGRELNIKVSGRMEGGGGGGNVGFYVDRSDNGKYEEWLRLVTERYNAWTKVHLGSKKGGDVTATIIEPVLAEGASVVERAAAPVAHTKPASSSMSADMPISTPAPAEYERTTVVDRFEIRVRKQVTLPGRGIGEILRNHCEIYDLRGDTTIPLYECDIDQTWEIDIPYDQRMFIGEMGGDWWFQVSESHIQVNLSRLIASRAAKTTAHTSRGPRAEEKPVPKPAKPASSSMEAEDAGSPETKRPFTPGDLPQRMARSIIQHMDETGSRQFVIPDMGVFLVGIINAGQTTVRVDDYGPLLFAVNGVLAEKGVAATLLGREVIIQPLVATDAIRLPVRQSAIEEESTPGGDIFKSYLIVTDTAAFLQLMEASGFGVDDCKKIEDTLRRAGNRIEFWQTEAKNTSYAPLLIFGIFDEAQSQFAVNFLTSPSQRPIFSLQNQEHHKNIVVRSVGVNLIASPLDRTAGTLDVLFTEAVARKSGPSSTGPQAAELVSGSETERQERVYVADVAPTTQAEAEQEAAQVEKAMAATLRLAEQSAGTATSDPNIFIADVAPATAEEAAEAVAQVESAIAIDLANARQAVSSGLPEVISEFIAKAVRENGPGVVPDTLPTAEMRSIWSAVDLLNTEKIGIALPQRVRSDNGAVERFLLTDSVNKTLSDMRRLHGRDSIKTSEYGSKEDLNKLLRSGDPDVKWIVITEEELAMDVQSLSDENPSLFSQVRLYNMGLPDRYGDMKASEKSVIQARALTIAILMRLYENDRDYIRMILQDLLEGRLPDGVETADYISNITEPDAVKRIAYFLHKTVKLVETLGKQLRLLEKFVWSAA